MTDSTAEKRNHRHPESERFSVRLPSGTQDDIRLFMQTGRYQDKSEVIRDALRAFARDARERGEI